MKCESYSRKNSGTFFPDTVYVLYTVICKLHVIDTM